MNMNNYDFFCCAVGSLKANLTFLVLYRSSTDGTNSLNLQLELLLKKCSCQRENYLPVSIDDHDNACKKNYKLFLMVYRQKQNVIHNNTDRVVLLG